MHRDKLDSARDSRQVLIHSANAIFFLGVYIYLAVAGVNLCGDFDFSHEEVDNGTEELMRR